MPHTRGRASRMRHNAERAHILTDKHRRLIETVVRVPQPPFPAGKPPTRTTDTPRPSNRPRPKEES